MFKKNHFSAMRRFSDFLGLHDILVEKYLRSGRIIPPAPQKNIIGTTKVKMSSSQSQTEPGVGIGMEWVENRRAALERFLSRTAQHPVLCVDPEFVNFLQSDEELPRSVNTATLSGAGVMRLFNKVGETVNKITYKMDENDPVNFHSFSMPKFDVFFLRRRQWFEDKINEVENLDTHLQKLHSAIKALVMHRKELSTLTGCVAKSAAMLSTCEEHTGLSRALSQLADVEVTVAFFFCIQRNNIRCFVLAGKNRIASFGTVQFGPVHFIGNAQGLHWPVRGDQRRFSRAR